MDLKIFNFFHSIAGRAGLTDFLIIFFAKILPYFLVFGALIFFTRFIKGKFKKKFFVFGQTILTLILARGILTETIRFFYHRPRPFLTLDFTPLATSDSFSFPSGHATFFFYLAFVIFVFNKKLGWWFLGLSLLNGLARIAAALHWLSDILGGIGIALISFFAVKKLLSSTEVKLFSSSKLLEE